MDTNICRQGLTVAEDITNINCLKVHDSCMEEAPMPFWAQHVLPFSDRSFACNGPETVELRVGFLYEINHKQLPRKSPIQVEGIRAVLVTAINEFNVSVRSPSTHSLRNYLSSMNSLSEMDNNFRGRKYPDLDKQFVMGSKLAKELLLRQISPTEFMKQRHLRNFWLLPSKVTKISTAITNGNSKNETSVKGVCWSPLNCTGLVHHGVRRKPTYFERPSEKTPQIPSLSSLIKEEEVVLTDIKIEDEMECKTRKRKHEGWKENKEFTTVKFEVKKPRSKITNTKMNSNRTPLVPFLSSLIKEEEDAQTDIKAKDETKYKTRKRKHDGWKQNKSKAAKCEVKKPSSKTSNTELNISQGLWSQDRYKNAEVKMMEIMKAKGAVVGKPILRATLTMEARKHIGDTGLLAHVLKHMADEVAPNGEERFRRRHNAEGAMEYWLESADLIDVRREAGVEDPYWTPPSGWEPGDNPLQDPNFACELKLLKEEMSNIKKDVQELHLLKIEDEVDKDVEVYTKSSSESCNSESDTEVVSLEEDYEDLVKRKAQLEQQIAQIRKRNHEEWEHTKKSKEAKRTVRKPSSNIIKQKLKLSYGRWSQERYTSAEVKMLEILKAKGAVFGKPIVRQTLRMEARKHIGDTGLLDHILKHMADKVVPNGVERFRRRHSADGTMEYWLEWAGLVNVRREAGVKDPYWTPPPGWKPGDNPTQDPNYARELKSLKEQMSNIEKDVQAILLLKREERSNKAIVVSTKFSSENYNLESDTTDVSYQEGCENLI